MMLFPKLFFVLLLLLFLPPVVVWALPSDAEQPIHIEADTVDIDNMSGESLYQGNVHFSQGSIHLYADKVVVYSENNRRVTRIVANGLPVRYQQSLESQEEMMRAEADTIEYFALEQRLLLLNNAQLWQGVNEFSGSQIEYNTKTEVVRASGDNNGQERVRVVIQPEKRSPTEPDSPAEADDQEKAKQ